MKYAFCFFANSHFPSYALFPQNSSPSSAHILEQVSVDEKSDRKREIEREMHNLNIESVRFHLELVKGICEKHFMLVRIRGIICVSVCEMFFLQ